MTKLRKLALVLFCAITSGLAQSPQTAPTPSIVYAVHDPSSIKDYKTNPRVVHEMVNRLVLAATGQSDVAKMPVLSDTENTSNVSHFSKIVATEVTKIINVPVMSISETNGIAGCMYNMTIPNIDNWRRFAQGSRFGAESLAEIYANPLIAKKVVFNLMDGLIAQHAGGPQPQPNYAVHRGTLYASKDPVALDAMALKLLEEWRVRTNLRPIGSVAAYIDFASQLGVGNSATNRIEARNIRPRN